VSDEDATRMLATPCPQQVMRVGLVEFGERHDTRGQTGSTIHRRQARRPTNQVSAWQADRGSRPTRPTSSYRILARMLRVSGASTRMSRRCYEETAPVEFRLYSAQHGSSEACNCCPLLTTLRLQRLSISKQPVDRQTDIYLHL